MPILTYRLANGDGSLSSAGTKQDATFVLDEWDNAEASGDQLHLRFQTIQDELAWIYRSAGGGQRHSGIPIPGTKNLLACMAADMDRQHTRTIITTKGLNHCGGIMRVVQGLLGARCARRCHTVPRASMRVARWRAEQSAGNDA